MIEVELEVEAWLAALPQAAAVVLRAAEAALSLRVRGPGDVTVLLTDDETVRDLNARFRGKDVATNVLAFPAGAQVGDQAGDQAGDHLGDIALAYGVCAREADEQGKSLADHLSHLVVHGVLHLLGFDHMDEVEADAMEALERRLVGELGIADPYRVGAQPTKVSAEQASNV